MVVAETMFEPQIGKQERKEICSNWHWQPRFLQLCTLSSFMYSALQIQTPKTSPHNQYFSRGGQQSKCPNMYPFCTWKPAIHCPLSDWYHFCFNWSWHYELHKDVLGCMWVALCSNGRAESPQWPQKTEVGGFAWGNSICWPTSPNS